MVSTGPLTEPGALLDQAPCGFLTFGDDGRLLVVNATLLELLGYERSELAGRHVETILTVGTRIFYQTHLFPLARLHGRADEIFLLLRGKSGEEIGVFANVRRRGSDSSAHYDMALMRVSERQKYEEELLRAKRAAEEARMLLEEQAAELEATSEELHATNEELHALNEELEATNEELEATNEELHSANEESARMRAAAEHANRAKTDFLAVMSHELRTPLNAISGYLQILDMEIQGPLTEAQRDTIGRIDRAERHLLRLINDLLNLSKLEAGGVDYFTEDVRLDDVARSVMPMVEPQVAEKKLTFTLADADLLARADRDKLEQILLNLLSNAVKFTPEGGSIRVRGARSESSPGFVELSVTDDGIGIPADKLDAVFEPFVQVDSAKTRGAMGTGLGLAISRDLARGMGGDLTLSSRLGVGSTFTILLPAATS